MTSQKNTDEVSVVIAARNEAQNIGNCLKSLLSQEGIKEIIIVDDHSSDDTVSVVRQFILENEKVKLINASPLPNGWLGKTHAVYAGANKATGTFILFTDADVIFSKDVIAESADVLEKENLDFSSGMFGIYCDSIAEKISAPFMSAMAQIAFLFTRNKGCGTGAFNMVRRTTYIAAGGHAAIKQHIVDDVALARLVKNYSDKNLFASDLSHKVKVRLFEGWTGYWQAIKRSAIPFMGNQKIPAAIASCLCLLLSFITCLGCLFIISISITYINLDLWYISIPVALYFAGIFGVTYFKGWTESGWGWILFYPVPFLAMALAVIYSAFSLSIKPTIEWRGRIYATKELL